MEKLETCLKIGKRGYIRVLEVELLRGKNFIEIR